MGMGRWPRNALAALLAVAPMAVAPIASAETVTVGLVGFGIFLLKVALVAIVLSWLFRLLFGGRRRHEPVLVGPPIAEVSAPRRDKYEVEAERELDRELGL